MYLWMQDAQLKSLKCMLKWRALYAQAGKLSGGERADIKCRVSVAICHNLISVKLRGKILKHSGTAETNRFAIL